MILQNTAELNYTPQRIISLVPSQTELLHYLGLEKETIGITKFCVHPEEWYRTRTRVGGTKTISFKTIHDLEPDLIIANKEENVKEQVEELAMHYPVWITDVNNLNHALDMISDIGELTSKKEKAGQLIGKIKEGFNKLQTTNYKPQTQDTELIHGQTGTSDQKPRTAYLIWQKPYMTIGGDTFINDMLSACGFQNVFSDKKRYPEITISQLQTSNLKLLLLSSEPFPFKQKHAAELEEQLPGCRVIPVDGEMFSWYGSRLLEAPEYFIKLVGSLY